MAKKKRFCAKRNKLGQFSKRGKVVCSKRSGRRNQIDAQSRVIARAEGMSIRDSDEVEALVKKYWGRLKPVYDDEFRFGNIGKSEDYRSWYAADIAAEYLWDTIQPA